MLHEDNAHLIGSKVGLVHKDSISPRSVVRQRYLQLRIVITINEPLLAGFIQKQGDREESVGFNLNLGSYLISATSAG